MRILLIAACAAVALATGCSAHSPAASPAASAAPPADGGSYGSPRDIVAKITAAGVACSDYKPISGALEARDRGSCRDGNLVVSIYDREGDVEAHVENMRGLGLGLTMLTGRNWTVNWSDTNDLQKLRAALGGTLVIEPE